MCLTGFRDIYIYFLYILFVNERPCITVVTVTTIPWTPMSERCLLIQTRCNTAKRNRVTAQFNTCYSLSPEFFLRFHQTPDKIKPRTRTPAGAAELEAITLVSGPPLDPPEWPSSVTCVASKKINKYRKKTGKSGAKRLAKKP